MTVRPYPEGPWPRTVVGEFDDPVAQARAELKAALAAIEEKANLPRRVARATEEKVRAARRFSRRNPAGAAVAAVVVAAAVGAAVWGAVRLYTASR